MSGSFSGVYGVRVADDGGFPVDAEVVDSKVTKEGVGGDPMSLTPEGEESEHVVLL